MQECRSADGLTPDPSPKGEGSSMQTLIFNLTLGVQECRSVGVKTYASSARNP